MQLADFAAAIHRPKSGFRWHPTSRGLFLAPQDTGGVYDPFIDAKGLFLDFAKLQADEASILAFADRYGDLLHPGANSLTTWADAIARLAHAVGLWKAIAAFRESGRKDKQCLAPYVEWGKRGIAGRVAPGKLYEPFPILATTSRLVLPPHGSLREGELLAPAEWLLFYIVNAHMRPLWENEPDRQIATVSILPDASHLLDFRVYLANLVDVLWVQFAFAIRGDKRFDECKVCHRSFEIKGKRTDRLFCSDACRVRAHRDRWKRVAELHRLGRGPKQISTEVGLTQKAVKQWLKEHQ